MRQESGNVASVSLPRREGLSVEAPAQLRLLESSRPRRRFEESLKACGMYPLRANGIDVLQVNLGKLCNQACRHCHVRAGPDRSEVMQRHTMNACLDALEKGDIPVLDATGGAPEMNPHFRWFVRQARRRDRHVIDRCNLTILTEPGFADLPEFLAEQRVEIAASLPCYLRENVEAQRGNGTFDRSIEALRRLNAVGYGRPESGLLLSIVHNPQGPSLPPSQAGLEEAYGRELKTRYGIVFNRLLTITNMPIGRFLDELAHTGRLDCYMQLLAEAFNARAAAGVMCRTMLSVDWTGRLYDCDFNQMLGLGLAGSLPPRVEQFDPTPLACRPIVVGQHCYGCTAGAGSSCRGTTAQAATGE